MANRMDLVRRAIARRKLGRGGAATDARLRQANPDLLKKHGITPRPTRGRRQMEGQMRGVRTDAGQPGNQIRNIRDQMVRPYSGQTRPKGQPGSLTSLPQPNRSFTPIKGQGNLSPADNGRRRRRGRPGRRYRPGTVIEG